MGARAGPPAGAVDGAHADYIRDVARRLRALRKRGLTLRAIAEALHTEGRRPREAARWNLMVLHHLLRRPAEVA